MRMQLRASMVENEARGAVEDRQRAEHAVALEDLRASAARERAQLTRELEAKANTFKLKAQAYKQRLLAEHQSRRG